MERYVRALIKEIERWQQPMEKERMATLFLGGGTPSLLPLDLMAELMGALKRGFTFAEEGEWTLEANPDVISEKALLVYRELGFNRLSLGLQAIQPNLLSMLGRRSGAEQFLAAVSQARAAGFNNINADLMASLPGQRAEDLISSVDFAIASGVEHVSLYCLVVHDATPLGKKISAGELIQPDEDSDREMFETACTHLNKAGLHRYEISNFARSGCQSRHNRVYWENKPYLGLGVAAASSLQGRRWSNVESLDEYCIRIKQGEETWEQQETISEKESAFETLMLGLRLVEGVDRRRFEARYGFDYVLAHEPLFKKWQQAGFATVGENALCLSAKGLDVQNALLVELMLTMEKSDLGMDAKAIKR